MSASRVKLAPAPAAGRPRPPRPAWLDTLLDHRPRILAGIAVLAIAAGGLLHLVGAQPVAGALFQELIDLAVILNALRALRG